MVGLLIFSLMWSVPANSQSSIPDSSNVGWIAKAQPGAPKAPIDLFRQADNLTNIRMPGSAPFHMKVTFHAFPGIDFSKPGKSTIVTGDGTYDEIWISPETWRREVTLDTYHAVEIRADGVRKFQATSDYEPSRIMMLLGALLDPIPRAVLEPELYEDHSHWRVEHLTTGAIPWVRISTKYGLGRGASEARAYDFLPNGTLVRREDEYTELLTSWDGDGAFGGKLVPRHLSVQGSGLGRFMVTAEVAVQALHPVDHSIAQLQGEPADPGTTMRPLTEMDNGGAASPIHLEPPPPGFDHYPADVRTTVIAAIDRQGKPHEVELSAIHIDGQRPRPEDMDVVSATAQRMVDVFRKDRFHPALIDGSPCQVYWTVITVSR